MAFAAVLRAGLLAVPPPLPATSPPPFFATSAYARVPCFSAAARALRYRRRGRPCRAAASITASLDLTEDNLGQLFDTSVGITGQVDLAELDGPFVKLRLKGKFWHTRATVVARIGNYLKNRIPVRISRLWSALAPASASEGCCWQLAVGDEEGVN
ncbi:hypothetical protein BAE44_0001606 [Dichanthelium oligosanthes]|uniref:Uncharacterized protein n=1 Tax=Dichanthelium oligosanthes TaxID=888268 RepID=A0A1E5WIZ3_9POAL|nr:hypothetical protein BAE44_0001606 [Dichanthelium oligosanthes]